jgi:hypothetical protein
MPDLNDVHGYIRFARLLVWPALFALIVVAIAIGIVLSTTKAAH